MNFFGHIVVASWHSSDPAHALGSMLPDLASMCGGRVLSAHDTDVAAGIELHHRTDKVFHTLDAFSELERDTTERLQARGVHRGGSMGAAHVAVELLLDGLLLDHDDACDLYMAALECEAARTPGNSMIVWKEAEQAMRFQVLRGRIRAKEVLDGYRDPNVVTQRVARVLSGYKTLALSDREVEYVRAEMVEIRRRVATQVPAIMDGLREQLTQKSPRFRG